MKKVVSFSGGRTSAYLCYLMKEMYGNVVDFVFMDTGAEHPKTYEFVRKCNDYFGLKLTCLRTKFNPELGKANSYSVVSIDDIKPDLKPFSEMMEKYGTPYVGGMFCTDRMKLVPFTKYCNDKYGRGNYETWLGIRADEPKRILGDQLYLEMKNLGYDDFYDLVCIYESLKCDGIAGLHGWLYMAHGKEKTQSAYKAARKRLKNIKQDCFYLAEISDFDKEGVLDFWSEMPFDLDLDEWNGNCVFCPKKSNLKLAAAQFDNQEMYHDFLSMLYSDSVRHDEKTGHWSQMYRGKKSLEQVVAMFDSSTGGEIKSRIRGGKLQESGSCSESCEVFNCQIDMF